MSQSCKLLLSVLIVSLLASSALAQVQRHAESRSDVSTTSDTKTGVPLPPIDPPEGFKWVLNDQFSDEFDGNELDSEKWHDTFPGWEGRVPGKFVPEAISIADGMLKVRCHILDKPQGDNGQWKLGCGAVRSKSGNASYGYYECRMKASSLSTSSTFWLKTSPRTPRPFISTELDIVECIGNAQRWPSFATQMKSNTHIELIPESVDPDETEEQKKARKDKKGGGCDLPNGARVNEDFHTYGCWWKDATHLEFFLDGKPVYKIEVPTNVSDQPMSQPMHVNLVCEIYSWEKTPLDENLRDDRKNTTYYDYVRAYKLVPIAK